MTIFDTNIVIDYFRGKREAGEIIKKAADKRGISLSAVSCYELLGGALALEGNDLEALFSKTNIYPLDLKSARIAGRFYKEFREKGIELGVADTLILATAKANDEAFVTQDNGFVGTYEKVIILGRKK